MGLAKIEITYFVFFETKALVTLVTTVAGCVCVRLVYLDRSPLRLELPTRRHFQLQLRWHPGSPLCFYGPLDLSV